MVKGVADLHKDKDDDKIPSQWRVEGSSKEYSEETFFVKFQSKTETEPVVGRVSSQIHNAMTQVLAFAITTSVFPYKTMGDIVKDSVVHRMKFLVNHMKHWERHHLVAHALAQEISLERLVQHHKAQQAYERILEGDLRPVLLNYKSMGEEGRAELVGLLHATLEQIHAMPSSFWRQRYRKWVYREFGDYLETDHGPSD